MAIINGRRINVPNGGMYGSDILHESNEKQGRRTVIRKQGTQFETVDPNKLYSERDLIDKKGNPVKVTSIPDRTKGVSYGAERSEISKAIITEQVIDIAEHYLKAGVEFDENNADWIVAPKYKLPQRWSNIARFSPLLIVFPTEYPAIPPIGFYLKEDIPLSPDGHFFNQVYHEACKDPISEGWKWYCVYVNPGSWQPAKCRRPGDWKKGDNLWTYFTLINEVLNSRG